MNFNFGKYLQDAMDWGVRSGWKVILIVVLMLVGIKLSGVIAGRLFPKRKREEDIEYEKRASTLRAVVGTLLIVTIILIGSVMILGEFDIEIGPILAAAGVVGVAVGFGAQHLVRDVITGFFILLDDQKIEIPFPHVTLYLGQDKDGRAAPVHVAVQKN